MATIIDQLIVELGLDPAKFQKGQKEAVDSLRKLEDQSSRTGKNVQQHVAGVEQGFSLLQKRMLGVAALFLGGLGVEQFIQKVTRLNVALANTAGTLGVSAQNLRAWQLAGERFGFSGEGVTAGFSEITRQRTTYQNTRDPGRLWQFQYGASQGSRNHNPVNLFGADRNLLPDEEVAKRLSQWLETETKAGRGVQGQAALRDVAGLPQEFVQFLAKGPAEINRILAETKKLAPTEEEVKRFNELNTALESASQNAQRLSAILVDKFTPALVSILNGVSSLLDTMMSKSGAVSERDQQKLTDKTNELRTVQEQLEALKHSGGSPLGMKALIEQEKALENEIRKLRESMGLPQLQKSSWGGSGFDSSNVIQASWSGGGAQFGGGAARANHSGSGNSEGSSTGGPLPTVPGGVIDRSWAKDELRRKPWLRDKIMRIAANEQGRNPLGTTAIIESLMNRAQQRGTNLEREARWYRSEGGYYAEGSMGRGALENPRSREVLERALESALGGSNVSDYATDNSSGGLAARERASGKFTFHKGINGESFFSPGWGGGSGRASRAAYERWRRGLAAEAARRGAGQAAGVPMPTPDPRGSSETWNDSRLMDGARFASMNTSDLRRYQNSMNIGEVNVHTSATDARGIASSIRPALQRFADVMSANNGPA